MVARAADRVERTAPQVPFRVAGNLYYVGSRDLAAFLVNTAEGNMTLPPSSTSTIYLWPAEDQLRNARYATVPYRDPWLAGVVAYVAKHEPQRQDVKMLCRDGYMPVERGRLARGLHMPDSICDRSAATATARPGKRRALLL